MSCVLNDSESVLAMVFRQENREFCVLTARRTSDEDLRLRGKKLALREIVIIVVHYTENKSSGNPLKREKAFIIVSRCACTVCSGLYSNRNDTT